MNNTTTDKPSHAAQNFSDMLEQLMEDNDRMPQAGKPRGSRGPVTQFPKLDKALGETLHPGLHVLHGAPGIGKTTFALQIASSCQSPALYVTCEVPPINLLRINIARVTDTYLLRLMNRDIPTNELEELAQATFKSIPQLSVLDGSQKAVSQAVIRQAALGAKGDSHHLLIVIDSLQSWAESLFASCIRVGDVCEFQADMGYMEAAVRALTEIAHELQCPILCIAEKTYTNANDAGHISRIGVQKIEHRAETVLDLERSPDSKEGINGVAEVTLRVVKNRHGRTGRHFSMSFNVNTRRFEI